MEPVTTPRTFSNRYDLTHLIARGGMAQVFRARDRLLDRPVAIKVLFPELSVDRAFVERFRREAQAAANLSHPNIVPVFDWGEDSGTYFIVMEFVDGQPLSALLRATGPLAPAKVADIGAPVAGALDYAHRHGVIHRDVKPGNVLITDDGEVKVTDFGIARAVNTEESLTQTGAVMGTATYFSPEQAEGVGVDARSDIYSLGVVLFEMVAGRPPFLGDTPVAVASKHVRDEPPDLRDLSPAIPSDLEAIITKSMAKQPDDRYTSADELRADLLRFADGQPVHAADSATTRLGRSSQATPGATGVVGRTRIHPADLENPYGEEFDPDDVARHRRTRNLILLLLGLVVVLGVVGFFLLRALGYSGTGSFSLPNVLNKSEARATAILRGDGLVLGKAIHSSSATVRRGDVAGTNPTAGTTVKKGDRIVLTVSSGKPPAVPKTTLVPPVVGTPLTDAEAVLQNATLKYHVNFVTSATQPTTVISESPKANATVSLKSVIILTVSKPTTTVPVPTVVGKTTLKASNAFGASNLQTGAKTQTCSTQFAKGIVIATNPGAGTSVAKNTSVALSVSNGPCSAVLPSVIGKTKATAETQLVAQGFSSVTATTISTCDQSKSGTVVAQSPTGGAKVATTSGVSLVICAPAPTTSSTTTTTPTSTTSSTTTTTTPPHP